MHRSNKEHTYMKILEEVCVAYIPTLAVLPYNTIIYSSKLKSYYLYHC